ncbi:MAG: cyclic nucleotide-binding domain-containing protein [Actinomycetota bacterium]
MELERLMRLPLFAELDQHDLSIVAHASGESEIAEGDLLIEQGAPPSEMFVIESGTAEVLRDGERIATLGPGDVVGEMGPIKLQRRMASVRATTPVLAVTLGSDALASIAREMPELAVDLRAEVERRERLLG